MKRKVKRTEQENKHGDHIASCLCCTHAEYYEGSPGYSDMTPGSPASLRCNCLHWDFDDCLSADLIQFMHDTGKYCADFDPRES